MTGAYSDLEDRYAAMKKDRSNWNGQKKTIREFNSFQEQKLVEVEDEVAAAPTNKILVVQKQQEES